MLGVTREAVNKNKMLLAREGLISTQGGVLQILDAQKLGACLNPADTGVPTGGCE